MKAISKFHFFQILLLIFSTSHLLVAQPEPAYGSFTFMNCSVLPAAVMLKVDGAAYRSKGYKPGEYTQGGQLMEGTHSLTVECEGAASLTLPFPVQKNVSVILLAYTVAEKKKDGTTENLMKLTQYPGKPKRSGFHYSAIYVSDQQPAAIYINGEPIALMAMKPKDLDSKGHLRVSTTPPVAGEDTHLQTPESLTFSPDRHGDYVLVVFDDTSGKQKFRLIQNISE